MSIIKLEMSYVNVPSERPLIGITMSQLIDEAAQRFGNKDMFHAAYSGQRMSFNELKQESEKMGAGLLKMGLVPGDRIGIWGLNTREWVVTYLAAAKAGLISVMINGWSQAADVKYSIKKCSIKCIVIGAAFKTQDYYKILCQIVPELEAFVISSEKDCLQHPAATPSLRWVITMDKTAPAPSTRTVEQVVQWGREDVMAREQLEKVSGEINFDQVFSIQLTSGSTGKPKGVMLTHHGFINSAITLGSRIGITEQVFLLFGASLGKCGAIGKPNIGPTLAEFGCFLGIVVSLCFGTTLVVPSPAYSSTTSLKVISDFGCTTLYGTPTMFVDLLNQPEFHSDNMKSLRIAVTGGAPATAPLINKIKVEFCVDDVFSLFGMTETGIMSGTFPGDSVELVCKTVGYSVGQIEVKIIDPGNGKIVPVGTPGELCYRGYGMMRGYWDEPELTKRVIDEAGWFHTGDVVRFTEEGYFAVVGRITDMIIRGGENVYPMEIENVLHSHPNIVDAHVFGVPDSRLGEAVAAWIQIKNDSMAATLTPEDVKEFCKGKISPRRIPLHIKFTNSFPRVGSGKVQKFVMREQYTTELGLL